MFDALFGLPVVILRPSMVYGPGQRDLDKVIPYVISTTLRGEVPEPTAAGGRSTGSTSTPPPTRSSPRWTRPASLA